MLRQIELKKKSKATNLDKKNEYISKLRKLENEREIKMTKLQSLCENVFDYAIRTKKVTIEELRIRFNYRLKDDYVYDNFEPLLIINIENESDNPYVILYTHISGYRAKSLLNNNLVDLNKFNFTEVAFNNDIYIYKFKEELEPGTVINNMWIVETVNSEKKFYPRYIPVSQFKYFFFLKKMRIMNFFLCRFKII